MRLYFQAKVCVGRSCVIVDMRYVLRFEKENNFFDPIPQLQELSAASLWAIQKFGKSISFFYSGKKPQVSTSWEAISFQILLSRAYISFTNMNPSISELRWEISPSCFYALLFLLSSSFENKIRNQTNNPVASAAVKSMFC